MMIKGAIIDLDGTLIDSMYIWDCLASQYLMMQGYKVNDEVNEAVKTMSLEEAAHYFQKNYHLSLSVSQIIEGINDLLEKYYREIFELKNGVKQFLEILAKHNIQMCIASASDEHLVNLVLNRCQIKHYFKDVFTCQQLNCDKNEPTIYNHALTALNLNKDQVIVLEDSYHGAKTAKDHGYLVVGVYDEYETRWQELKAISDVFLKDYLQTEQIEKIFELSKGG